MYYLGSPKLLPRRKHVHFMQKELRGRWGTVADIGCGEQPYRKYIDCETYLPLDIEARSEGGVILMDANIAIPLPDNSVDLAILNQVLHHLENPTRCIEECYRILKKGGTMLITAPMAWRENEAPNDFRRYTQYGMKLALRQAGFSDFTIVLGSGFWYSIIAFITARQRFVPFIYMLNTLAILIDKVEKPSDFTLDIFAIVKK